MKETEVPPIAVMRGGTSVRDRLPDAPESASGAG
jgi:hypothetical protein